MLGVVLCGGQSTRMGSDKGLLKSNAKTWAQIAIDKINFLQIPVVLSVNEKQLEEYSSVFSLYELIPDDDSLNVRGPLRGVLCAHLRHPHEDLMVLGCDMPLMEVQLLDNLISCSGQQPDHDAFIYTNDGEAEPLCGIYRAKGLADTYSLYCQNQLPKHSMKYMLEHISTYSIPVPADKKQCFRNFNAHAELNGL